MKIPQKLTLILFLFTALSIPRPAIPEELSKFQTRLSTIYYSQKSHLDDFLWKIGRIERAPTLDRELAQSRVDRIIGRVQDILGMHPKGLHVDILLRKGYKSGYIAFYSDEHKTITVYVDRVTDGVLAHEVGHAVIDAYFDVPVSGTVQEILCRYVDEQLWGDYY